MFGLCVSFSGTKLSYFNCVPYELNFHSVFDVATSCLIELKGSGIPCVAFPSWMKGSLPHVIPLSCSKCVYKQLCCVWCQPCKNSCNMANAFWQMGKVLERFSLWCSYCPNTEIGAKLLHLPQILQGCALCVCVDMMCPWVKLCLPVWFSKFPWWLCGKDLLHTTEGRLWPSGCAQELLIFGISLYKLQR